MNQADMADNPVETFSYGATRYHIDDGRITVIYGSGDMSRPAITAWANLVIETTRQAEPGSSLYLLLDLTNPHQGFTPYTRIVVEMIYKGMPVDRQIFAAVVLRDSILIQIISGLVNRLHRTRPGLAQHLFNNKETAINWLRQMQQKKTL